MRERLLGTCISLVIHGMAAMLLLGIIQTRRMQPPVPTTVIDLRLVHAGAGRKGAPSVAGASAPAGPANRNRPPQNDAQPSAPEPPIPSMEPRHKPTAAVMRKNIQTAPPAAPASAATSRREKPAHSRPPAPASAVASMTGADPRVASLQSGADTSGVPSAGISGQANSGSGTASAGSGDGSDGTTRDGGKDPGFNAHLDLIHQRLRNCLYYPRIARQRGWSGEVLVAFTIRADGLPDSIAVQKSCGIALLDRSALKTVHDASPFPAPPMTARIVVPILYQLD